MITSKMRVSCRNSFRLVFLFHCVLTCFPVIQETETNVYVVHLGERKDSDVEVITESHHQILASVLGSEATRDAMIYSYRHGFSGFAARMTQAQARTVSELAGVVGVVPNRLYKMHTTRSWDYLGLSPNSVSNLLHDTKQGDGAIIGIIDSGIWPESESFKDRGLGPIPSRWKGKCESGQHFNASQHCNNKLIGARFFIKGFLAAYERQYGRQYNTTQDRDFLSPRDADGHGTHCASTAAGSFVSNVSRDGLARGALRGGAPKSRLAIYKIGWHQMASSADVLKAFDKAIHDGVDVLSISWGAPIPLYSEIDLVDIIDYGSFHAVGRGIPVVCSGGNSGPNSQTVENVAPWVISVAASTMDRSFPTPIVLGNNQTLLGLSMYVGNDTGFLELVHGMSTEMTDDRYCESITQNDTWVAGKVLFCFSVEVVYYGMLPQGMYNALDAGALGIITAQYNVQDLSVFYRDSFPFIFVTYDVGSKILRYIQSTSEPKARVKPSKTYTGVQVSAQVASFSSRGPNSLSPTVLKPDIAAPGVDVLGATPWGYEFESGTSMAAPHVAGIAALLKSLHPDWSPAAMRSALVTTAWTRDPHSGQPIYAWGGTPKIADPFDYGGGLVNPNAARDPGLVYDMGMQDYISYLCAMGYNKTGIDRLSGRNQSCRKSSTTSHDVLDLNLPSITVPNLVDSVSVRRTVTNVGETNSTYEAVIDAPAGTVVVVKPMKLEFSSEVKRLSFGVTITSLNRISMEFCFGSLTWSDGVHQVKIPISVKSDLLKFDCE